MKIYRFSTKSRYKCQSHHDGEKNSKSNKKESFIITFKILNLPKKIFLVDGLSRQSCIITFDIVLQDDSPDMRHNYCVTSTQSRWQETHFSCLSASTWILNKFWRHFTCDSHLALTEGWSQPPQEGRDLQSALSLLTSLSSLGHFYISFLIWICHAFYALNWKSPNLSFIFQGDAMYFAYVHLVLIHSAPRWSKQVEYTF